MVTLKKAAKLALVSIGSLALLYVLGGAALAWLWCADRTVRTAMSPSGRYVAEAWESYCSVGSGWDSGVVIRERPLILSYLPWTRHAGVLALRGPADRVRLRWIGNSTLVIECLGCKQDELRSKAAQWNGISIRYSVRSGQSGHARP